MKNTIRISILSVAIMVSCKQITDEEELHENLAPDIVELSAEQFRVAGIEYGTAEQRTINSTLKVNGLVTVSPQDMASVCAPLGGFIVETSLMQGSSVKKGQILAILENPEFIELQQEYLETKSRLEYAEGEYQRHKTLYEDEVYSSKNLQEVTANYKSLRAHVNAIGQKLALIGLDASRLTEDNIARSVPLFSPISGYIKSVNVNVGKFVTPTDVVFEVVNTGSLILDLTLFEKDIHRVATGQKLNFTLPGDETVIYDAVIIQVSKAIGNDKTVKVFASVKTRSDRILPGMYVNAWIETSNEPVTAVPTQAITRFDDRDYIFIYERDKEENGVPFTEFKMIEIKKGITEKDYTGIQLPEGFDLTNSRVVIRGSYTLMAAKMNAGEMSC
jgi:cobalt-zinc-cadmium efflux system membrane fusion protein